VLCNQAVHTDREVTANRPDIIIKNTKEKTCTLIDVAIPVDRNVVQKEAEKKLKYKSLGIEIQQMWNMKCTIIPVIIGATGIVTKSLRKNPEAIPGKHSIDSLQQTAILGTSHIIRKVLQCETRSLSGGGHRWFKGSARKKWPVARDNNDDDDNNNNNKLTIFSWQIKKHKAIYCYSYRTFSYMQHLNQQIHPIYKIKYK
jgi:hypothetical protein